MPPRGPNISCWVARAVNPWFAIRSTASLVACAISLLALTFASTSATVFWSTGSAISLPTSCLKNGDCLGSPVVAKASASNTVLMVGSGTTSSSTGGVKRCCPNKSSCLGCGVPAGPFPSFSWIPVISGVS